MNTLTKDTPPTASDPPPIGVKLEVVCLIDPRTWAQAKAQGVSEADLQKAIVTQVTLIADKGLRLLWDIDSVKLVKYY